MISICRYEAKKKEEWNDFNKTSKNSLFMFDRNYMEYHSNRFIDHSLMFYDEDDRLIALLPMNENENKLISHGGLTYGGFITNERMKQHIMNECFDELLKYGKENGYKYKTIPYIFFDQPAEEDRFSLYEHKAKLEIVDASTYVNLKNPLKMPKGRKAQIARAKREGVKIEICTDMESYINLKLINLENKVLAERHETKAVHTAEELKMLHDRFPENIGLFVAIKEEKMIAGAVIFEYKNVIHTQYMAANEEARKIGGLDLVIATIIEKYKQEKMWLDFGISTEHGRIYLNEGLISQKEGFGGRTGVYETWKIDL